ncbi:MAG: hypothetical protein ACKVWR_07970 [Acidimicrobiales bacterium]
MQPADGDDRRPLGEVLPGFGIHALPPGWTPLEALVLVKSLDESGRAAWSYRTTHRPNREELLGALTVQADLLRKELLEGWE